MKWSQFCFMLLVMSLATGLLIPILAGPVSKITGKTYAQVNLSVNAGAAPPGGGAGGGGGGGKEIEAKAAAIPKEVIELAEKVAEPMTQIGIITGKVVKVAAPFVKGYWPILVAATVFAIGLFVYVRRKYKDTEE